MLQQPLRVGGLALTAALATATLALVTFLASNLVLSVVAGIGLGGALVATEDQPPAVVQGVLLSAEQRRPDQPACRARRNGAEHRQDADRARSGPCRGQRQVGRGAGRQTPP